MSYIYQDSIYMTCWKRQSDMVEGDQWLPEIKREKYDCTWIESMIFFLWGDKTITYPEYSGAFTKLYLCQI